MMRANAETFLMTASVLTFSLILVAGVWLIAGWYIEGLWPATTRYSLGAVMTLYALYRIATARSRFRRKDDGHDADETDEIDDDVA
jgi:membrane protein YdbS with pleckstrin-like domain